ncbi:sugar phosphate isomerase/epimerase family protein [Anaerocolumna sp. MB42-C2]|uniref:sugar phosphate isomerase/epimerase family protein n=1 Tax=Anaerocolumna sp. MB42-C2 TaxID=3070997 RepID=UPI0027DFCB4D|nr:sugar phosphate isomerase/epimerase family protein [Anaerocolumna sp. MB42-C2]WMJ89153.1 sugar phosphate isomerase/epimerase family protein [Anaerocolumna sp. MB42-C2]
MKFAPMNYHYLRYPIKKFLDKVENSPFDSIDLYCSAPQLNMFDYPLSRLIDLDKDIRRRKLSVMAMTPENCTYPVNFCTSDNLTRESSVRYYQRAIDTAEFLGCPNVQISTGFGYFDHSREEAWKYCRESMVTLAAYCEKKNVRLLLEELKTTTTNVLITSKDIAQMLKEIGSESIVGMVDLDQMTYADETVDDWFNNLGEKLKHIHFNDRGHTVPGDGDFPMKEYYEAIKRRGYEGTVSFEICDRRYYCDPDKAIDDIIAWIKMNTNELN